MCQNMLGEPARSARCRAIGPRGRRGNHGPNGIK